MAQKQISRFPLNEKFSGLSVLRGLSGHVPNYEYDITLQHKLSIYTPCVTALILSECTNSSREAAQTALSQAAPNIINLDPHLPSLCTVSSSLREDEQHDFTVRTALSRTAPNSVTTSSPPSGRGGHLIE